MANHKHFKRGQNPTFKCVTCERNTRDTGQGVDHLCEDCFEIAGLDNQVNDSGEPVDKATLKECTARLAKIKKLGGNVERVKAHNTYIWATAGKPAAAKETPAPAADGLDIPAFLKRQKDGSLPKSNYEGVHPAKKSGILKRSQAERSAAGKPFFAPPVKEPTILETLEPKEFREYVEKEIKAHRIQGKWLSDGTTIELLRGQWGGKVEKKEEGLARLAEYKAEHPRPVKVKATHAEDALHILHHDTANPRKVGSANHAKYEAFKAFMVKNPKATVGEVLAGTNYYRNDLMWDVKQGRIKLGEAPAPEQPKTAPVKAKPTPAAKKEAKGLPPVKAKKAKK
jgi:hypothetical protein